MEGGGKKAAVGEDMTMWRHEELPGKFQVDDTIAMLRIWDHNVGNS